MIKYLFKYELLLFMLMKRMQPQGIQTAIKL
jgi:hypothetical protein